MARAPTEGAGVPLQWPTARDQSLIGLIDIGAGEIDPTDQAAWAHGSPIDRAGTYVDQANKTLVTRCWPLQWNPGAFGWGSSHDHPVVWWKGTFSKQVTLDMRTADGVASPNVIRWSPSMHLPTTTKPITVQVVAGFLDEDFHVYEMFDASRDYVEGVNPTDFSTRIMALGKQQPVGALDSDLRAERRLNPKAGGSILSTPDGKYALGCYRGPSAASPNLTFAMQDFRQIDYRSRPSVSTASRRRRSSPLPAQRRFGRRAGLYIPGLSRCRHSRHGYCGDATAVAARTLTRVQLGFTRPFGPICAHRAIRPRFRR